jgi:hypothetical protein
MSERIVLRVPSCFVVPAPKKPEPPPFPGTVTPESLRPDPDPPIPFLVPWRTHTATPRVEGGLTIPVMVDAAMHAKAVGRFEMAETTLAAVFKGQADAAALTAAVIKSMENPFAANDSPITWAISPRVFRDPLLNVRLAGKKLAARHRALLQGTPWSIRCFGEPGVGPRKNVIYGGDGHAIAQVDFGHSSVGIHVHALVRGNAEHAPVIAEDHLFRLRAVPWAWCVIPDVTPETAAVLLSRRHGGGGGGGAVDSDEEDEDLTELLSVGQPLPDTAALDDMDGWCRLSLPFDNMMGSGSTSFE